MTDAPVPEARKRAAANRAFPWIVGVSLGVHVLAFGGVIAAQASKKEAPIVVNAVPVQLVALGKRRDPKLLPRKVEEVAAAQSPDGVSLDTGKTPSPSKTSTKKTDQKLSDAARRLLEGGSTSSDARLDAAASKLEDREGDPNGHISGTTTDPSQAASGYQRSILVTLQDNYRLPETIPASQRKFLKAQVLLYIERDGSIARYEFVERHPNDVFMGALESMLRQIKMPPPPPDLADAVKDGGVLVRFSL
ncbi:TonB C-terminal domain-containing protein [Myxococcota bacterium]|nr:TonB C-terminal domain-containing protein [Myxococcota bacterium]